ncbi:hypothetical protein NQ317_015454 [Molorchus minor]|uniref:Uncharacterized protein n=1 Tax=Molorchus minor TaxID=1323400 RepID=A0ABQ9JSP2_9CUCU|nr:hypothetical protein NQ317_015454 [Molorchus minor]
MMKTGKPIYARKTILVEYGNTCGDGFWMSTVQEKVTKDSRKLSRVPEDVNHDYGWVAKEKDFQLDIWF